MRPGKPLAFGRIGDTPFIGSPGNPVSLFVTFCLFARPFILRMQGFAPQRVSTATSRSSAGNTGGPDWWTEPRVLLPASRSTQATHPPT
jgi:molybdopterin biosynthesis enzyme